MVYEQHGGFLAWPIVVEVSCRSKCKHTKNEGKKKHIFHVIIGNDMINDQVK